MASRALLTLALILAAAAPTQARHHHKHNHSKIKQPVYSWDRHKLDLTPVAIKSYATPRPTLVGTATPAAKSFVRKMNLEDGLYAHGTQFITRPDIRSRDLFILHATQSLEGGFDTVNLYDKGIISWGLMQWTARSGSLTECLKYVKRSLISSGDRKVWEKYFVSNGVDVTAGNLVFYGKPMVTPQDMRLAIRGTMKVGQGDPNLMNHWVTTFARAGRQGQIAGLEIAYASRVVDAMMYSRLDGVPYRIAGRDGVTPADLAGDDPFTQALMFAIWTNNPKHARKYIGDAARAARAVSSSDDPSLWAPGTFSDALFRECNESTFGNWAQRAALIDARADSVRTASASELSPYEAHFQQVLADRKQARLMQIASRHAARNKPKTIASLPKARVAARKPVVANLPVAVAAKPMVVNKPMVVAAKPTVVRIAGISSSLETRHASESPTQPIMPTITVPQVVIKTYGRLNVHIPCEPAAAKTALPSVDGNDKLSPPQSAIGDDPNNALGAPNGRMDPATDQDQSIPDPSAPIKLPGGTIPGLPN